MKILVVDDDAALRLSVTKTLVAAGHEVVEAEDGAKAVALVSLDKSYDAVFLDVNMPKMSGVEALKKIKEISPQTFLSRSYSILRCRRRDGSHQAWRL